MGLADQFLEDAGQQAPAQNSPASGAPQYADIDAKHGYPIGFMAAVARKESNNNPNAVSKKGAQGIFQMLPSTQKNPGYGLGPLDPNNAEHAAQYLDVLKERAGGDLFKGLAMYNAGEHGKLNNPETNDYVKTIKSFIPVDNLASYAQGNQQQVPAPQLGGPTPQVSQLDNPAPTEKPSAPTGLAASFLSDAEPASAAPGTITNNTTTAPSTTQNLLTGIGHGMVTTAGNVKQGFDMAANKLESMASGTPIGSAISYLSDKLGIPTAKQSLQNTNQALAENQKYGAGATNTTAGTVGDVVGQTASLLPTMLIPGATTLAGGAAVGAGAGLAATPGSLQERGLGAAGGALGGALGVTAGKAMGAGATRLGDMITNSQTIQDAANAGRQGMTQLAQKYGLKVSPQASNPGTINSMLGGISGKIATSQDAATMNQPIINNIVKKELGLASDAPLNPDTLAGIRQQAGAAYDTVRNSGVVTPGQDYHNALDTILKNANGQAKSFPGLKSDDITNVIGTLKQNTFDAGDAVDATRFLRNMSDKAYASGDKQIGSAYKQASGAIEDAIGDHLAKSGDPQALANFQNARQTIAKTYSVQKAMNPATGDIDAGKLAGQLNKGKPLSGGLKDIAQMNNAFPKDTQLLKSPYQMMSPLDYGVGLVSGIASGNPLAGAAVLARPLLRSTLLSSPVQSLNAKLGSSHYLGNLLNSSLTPLKSQPLSDLGELGAITYGKNNQR